MCEAEGRPAETAYFVLFNQDLLAEPRGRLAADACLRGAHCLTETWTATVAALRQRRDSLAAGTLEAPGATGDDLKPAFFKLAPPCRHCSFPGICGLEGAR
jgi:hypothetical protein